MSFLYPLGLLGLIGIPILIIIYIIKSKYTEQTVSSTYLWTLSEKFIKRKNPISRLVGLISLILQILAVAALSFAIAHPIVTLPDAAYEYCFILDGSGSMNMVREDGRTRFEAGKDEIAAIIDSSVNGSRYSLVYVGDATTKVYERLESPEQAKSMLSELEVAYGDASLADAIGIAQEYFNEVPTLKAYFATDKSYETNKNISLLDVSGDEVNFAVTDVVCDHLPTNELVVTGNLISYTKGTSLKVNMYVNGSQTVAATGSFVVKAGEPTPFRLSCEAAGYNSVKVVVENADALSLDNEYVIYNEKSESEMYRTLLVSDTPFFMKAALTSVTDISVDVVSSEEYNGETGYGLYIFDSFTPETMPRDGAVWIINPGASLPDSGYTVQGEVELPVASRLTVTKSTASSAKKLTADLVGNEISITKYVKCGLYRNFTTLFSCEGNPVVFAGTNTYGNREVVFAFNLHDSNLPVLYDYVVLVRNLVGYSFPEMIERTDYFCGDNVEINLPANCESVKVDTPLGNVIYLDTSNAVTGFVPNEVGTYTVTLNIANSQRKFNVYAAMTESERAPSVSESELSLLGEAEAGGIDGKFDGLTVLFIALAVIFIADWMVYCYEKYQLR